MSHVVFASAMIVAFVVVELDVPNDLAPYADMYRANVENFLIGILGPQAPSAS